MAKTKGYNKHFSDDGFWEKLSKYARTAGEEVIEKALWLYYVLQKPDTPAWAKATVIGALGYLIWPLDAIPDFLGPIGYVDDLGVLAAAVTSLSMYIDKDIKEKARQKLRDWFS